MASTTPTLVGSVTTIIYEAAEAPPARRRLAWIGMLIVDASHRGQGLGPRLLVPLPDELSDETAAERAALIFGLQNFSLSYSTPRDIESISREAIKRATGSRARSDFQIETMNAAADNVAPPAATI